MGIDVWHAPSDFSSVWLTQRITWRH